MCTMTGSIICMVLCELELRRRCHGVMTYTLPRRLHPRSCPNLLLKLLQWPVCFWFQYIPSILSRRCDSSESGTREWISILRTRLPILPNTKRPFWSMWRVNTVPNIEDCPSWNLQEYRATIFPPPEWLLDLLNLVVIHILCPAMMKNAYCLES